MRVRNGIWIALALLFALTAAALLHETRGTTLWFDEWQWAMDRRGTDAATFLDPHNGHLSLVPILLYKLLFAAGGLTDYAPYRVAIVIAHLVCVTLVFVYLRRRVGDVVGALGAVVILLLGPAWQNILWPFQIGSVTSLAAGLGALLALDARRRAGDVAACALVALSLASSGLGVIVGIGVAVDVLVNRQRPRDLWIVAAPVIPYALWWLVYQDSDFTRHNLVLAPGFAADAAAGALAALSGLSGVTTSDTGASLPWGRPLAVAGAAAVGWRLWTMGPVPRRAITVSAMAASFWLLTAVQRADESSPDSSRYLYVGAVLCVLLAAELSRGVRFSVLAVACLSGLVALAGLANLGDLRDASRLLREQAAIARADLTALELARATVPADHVAVAFPGYPFLQIRADTYFDAARELGSPAFTPAELTGTSEAARAAADRELTAAEGLALRPAADADVAGAPLSVDAAISGTAIRRDDCVRFRPDAVRADGDMPELQLTLPSGGVHIRSRSGSTILGLRRFASSFPETELGRLTGASSAELRLRPDSGDARWHLRVRPDAGVTACGLS